jgi:hypothetical protein
MGDGDASAEAWVPLVAIPQTEHFFEPLHGRIYAALL